MRILFILFTLLPAIELYLLFKVGGEIGGLNTILIIIATGFLGATLAKSQGLDIIHRIQKKSANGEVPSGELLEGFLIFGGGLLLLTPGFLTDAIGLSMVFPVSRIFLKTLVQQAFKSGLARGFVKSNVKFYSFNEGTFGKPFDEHHDEHYSENKAQEFNKDANREYSVFEAEYRDVSPNDSAKKLED